MAPQLDLSHTTHAKIMVAPPRLNLRRAASYTGSLTNEKQASVSGTSSKYAFNHLLYSPPPSPGLPALVTRPRKSSNTPRPSRFLRMLAWAAGLAALVCIVRMVVKRPEEIPVVSWAVGSREEYEMVGQDELPDFPTPIAVTDVHGRSKWTVSIPPTYSFPLSTQEYSEICDKCHEVAAHVRELHRKAAPSLQAQTDYYYKDPYFLDVSEAEERGLLPGVKGEVKENHLVGQSDDDDLTEHEPCKSSLTFVLESPEAGMGSTLMMLWMAYGMAQKEKRAFFIDDTRWAYGEYTKIFQRPPMPDCLPPPRHEMLPCPRNARHLLVSPATARHTFGEKFSNKYEHLGRLDSKRERPMFDLARAGYEALFRLNKDDDMYATNRIRELRSKAKVPQSKKKDGSIVGVHVRHGDQHPFEYQYNGAYIPLNVYTDRAREILDGLHNSSASNSAEEEIAKQHSVMVVASDDPDVYDSEEFSKAPRAQEMIKLASKSHPPQKQQDRTVMHKFVEEAFGWEGGFFSRMFWNLGRSSVNNVESATAKTAPPPSKETTQLRSYIGRAYLLDLAVLAKGSDVVVCAVSATGCRLMAVMMGWDKAIARGDWVNIDGNYQWTALGPLS